MEVLDSSDQQNVNSEESTNTCNKGIAAFLYNIYVASNVFYDIKVFVVC